MKLKALAMTLALSTAACSLAQEKIIIDTAVKGHDINPDMYGIFFEEINHSGDGGLYPELVQNRGFEEQTLPGGFKQIGYNRIQTAAVTNYNGMNQNQLTWDWDFATKKMTGWKLTSEGCRLSYSVTSSVPLHENTPNAMAMVISNSSAGANARLINTGYWGMAVEKGEKYDLRFYLRTSNYSGKVNCLILNADGKEISRETFDVDKSGQWKEYKGVMTPSETIKDGEFALEFSGDGTIYVDYVSLFPQNTFCGRSNGLRPDIAQLLVDLKPGFMRWPGGCIVEGIMLDNRVNWKETIGDPMTRPGQYDLWGYRCSWGLGYHEMLQFCEDAGMDFMFVGNAGLSCCNWGGEYVSGNAVEPYYQDIKDAIEYAIGDPATNSWAARRAQAGHPAPFPLKYVEIGNENFSARYDANFKYIYDKLKAEYPQLVFLNTMGIDDAENFNLRLGNDMIDPHWYVAPEFFYNSRTIFDNTPRGHYNIYVGEYATNTNVGQGNHEAALSEAVFMMSMERNSDIVKMASYAPLITNDNAPNWSCNLIWQHSGESFGRASYYVQKLFSENLPTHNIGGMLQSQRTEVGYNGRAGVGTWLTGAQYRNFKVTDHSGKTLYAADFANQRGEWTDMQGAWSAATDGTMSQSDKSLTRCISLMNAWSFRDCVIEVEARKTSGDEGFLLVFGCDDEDWNHYYQFNVGGWGNTATAIEDVSNGGGIVVSNRHNFRVQNNKWYKLKVVCRNGRIEGWIDGELCCTYDMGTQTVGRIAAHAGYDSQAGEIVLKVVNAEEEPLPLSIQLNAKNIASTATAEVLKSESLWDENSFSMPKMISPVKETIKGVSENFEYSFAPYSLTVLRIKAENASSPIEMPQADFSSVPRKLSPAGAENRNETRLKEMIEEGRSVMLDDVEGYNALRKAVDDAVAELNSGNEKRIANAILPLQKAMNAYYKLQIIEANELTRLITNPHFEKNGDNSGWRGNMTVRAHVAEMFNNKFNISQTVEGLEPGYYMVYAQAYYRNGGHPEAYQSHADGSEDLLTTFHLNDMRKPVVSIMGETHSGYWYSAPNSMEEAREVLSANPDHYANYLMAYVGEDGKLQIRFAKDQGKENDWFLMDNVRLFRVPTSHSGIIGIKEAIAAFSPAAQIFDLQGRLIGNYAGLSRLSPGIYLISENGRSAKIRK